MTIRNECTNCGYKTDSRESVCPICGGNMRISSSHKAHAEDGDNIPKSILSVFHDGCDEEKEKEWNNGYHDDYSEQHKTGDYCDRELEKNTNGGQHYHNENSAESTLSEEQTKKITTVILCLIQAIGIFSPFIGAFLFITIIFKIGKGTLSSCYKKPVIITFIIAETIGMIIFILQMRLSGISYLFR